jgi:hypothetical protein
MSSRNRPWYTTKITPKFTDMLGALRLQRWEYEVLEDPIRNRPRRNAFNACSTSWRLLPESPKG